MKVSLRNQSVVPFDIPRSCVVYTPAPLATAIVRALGDSRTAQWLEPSVGEGVFLESLSAVGVSKKRIRALDLDVNSGSSDALGRTLRGRDFFKWSRTTRERFSRIVANPPYLAINRLPVEIQTAALSIPMPGDGRVPLGSNCWLAFLCASLRLLRPGGSLGFLLPAAWQYSDYAASLRRVLPTLFKRVEVHRSQQPLFTNVQEGSIVLLCREFVGGNALEGPLGFQQFEHASGDDLIAAIQKPKRSLANRKRRNPVGQLKPRLGNAITRLTLRDVMEIRLGGVTGDASFFLLTEQERKALDLPVAALRRAISRAHHLKGGAITKSRWDALKLAGERVWLFHPTVTQSRKGSVCSYLRKRLKDGGCNKDAFKVRCRDPWYQTPLPTCVDGFMSGMSTWGPWVVFREMPSLTATNTLYVIRFLTAKTIDEKAAWAMWLLSTKAQRRLRAIGRRYADGLLKFEPGDIGRLVVDRPIKTSGAYRKYQRAVRLLLAGKRRESQQIADAWFRSQEKVTARRSYQPSDRRALESESGGRNLAADVRRGHGIPSSSVGASNRPMWPALRHAR
jgi:adenine-specific DNA-methyltransferase